ncbi:MAG: site-2 protease family protein [Clostridia bacterium]|nr:site-2 protease family protein [Clostridia bacterium]
MINALITGGVREFLISTLLSLPIVFLALSVHETAHGYVAYKLGDPTARNLGRLTLNPIKHIDPIGFICMVLCGYGWAKPVPVNTRYFKKPKRDMALTGLAGPLSNLILAIIFALLYRVEYMAFDLFPPTTELMVNIYYFLEIFLILGINLNITLAVFNLIPCPPFDGSRIFLVFLPTNIYFKIMKYEQYIYIALMIALVFGLLDGPIDFVSGLFRQLVFRLVF